MGKSQIMKRAWNIATEGKNLFGGKKSEYLSEALKQAWKESRMDINTATKITVKNDKGMVELNKENDTDKWYVTYNGKTTSAFYNTSDMTKMIADGNIYGEITYA